MENKKEWKDRKKKFFDSGRMNKSKVENWWTESKKKKKIQNFEIDSIRHPRRFYR